MIEIFIFLILSFFNRISLKKFQIILLTAMSSKYIKTIGFPLFLGLFHAAFIILIGLFAEYNISEKNEEVPTLYASKLSQIR